MVILLPFAFVVRSYISVLNSLCHPPLTFPCHGFVRETRVVCPVECPSFLLVGVLLILLLSVLPLN